MNSPFDRLPADLADLAEQVTVVDLRDRALRSSRNLGIRRLMLGAAAAVVVVAVAAGTAFAVLPGRGTGTPAGPGSSNQPTVAASPSTTPPTGTQADAVPGMYLFVAAAPNGDAAHDILYRAPSGDWRKVATVPDPLALPQVAVAVSPDHQHLAWFNAGKLQVSALDGSRVATVVADAGTSICQAPRWAADSRHLLFRKTAINGTGSTIEAVDIDGTGLLSMGTTSEAVGCNFVSSDGSTVYAAHPGSLIALDGTSTARTVVADWPSGQQPWDVLAASPGSTRLLVGTAGASTTCGCSPPRRYAVLDTATGEVTSLDNTSDKQGSSPVSGALTADGRVVLIAAHTHPDRGSDLFLTVFGSDGTITGSPALPPMGYGYFVGLDG